MNPNLLNQAFRTRCCVFTLRFPSLSWFKRRKIDLGEYEFASPQVMADTKEKILKRLLRYFRSDDDAFQGMNGGWGTILTDTEIARRFGGARSASQQPIKQQIPDELHNHCPSPRKEPAIHQTSTRLQPKTGGAARSTNRGAGRPQSQFQP
ncbi:MAG: hypothetical protein ACYDH9_04830 [Limisphaerales bacterium]